MRRVVLCAAILCVAMFMTSRSASAQASLAGVVRDGSGAVLPGVTVEASSPALIEKTRSVVTNGSGQYRIVDLSPGTYQVSFTLAGFKVVRRADVVLPGNFTAPVTVIDSSSEPTCRSPFTVAVKLPCSTTSARRTTLKPARVKVT